MESFQQTTYDLTVKEQQKEIEEMDEEVGNMDTLNRKSTSFVILYFQVYQIPIQKN